MNIENAEPVISKDIFAEEDIFQFEYASSGQRFLNWLIDNLFMRYALNWASGYVIGYFLANLFPEFYLKVIYSKGFEYYTVIFLIIYLNYIFYYTLCEKLFRGYTLGKLITGTRAIREDGKELSFKNAILRSLCRIVPFEVLSGFGGHPWHDGWTNTMVIKSR